MASPEFKENPVLGQELLVGVSMLVAAALERSGLLAVVDLITYSSVELSKDYTPDEEINLFIGPDPDGHHIVTLSENTRIQDAEEETFNLETMASLILHKDGTGFASRNEQLGQDEELGAIAEHIARRLPDFTGAEG